LLPPVDYEAAYQRVVRFSKRQPKAWWKQMAQVVRSTAPMLRKLMRLGAAGVGQKEYERLVLAIDQRLLASSSSECDSVSDGEARDRVAGNRWFDEHKDVSKKQVAAQLGVPAREFCRFYRSELKRGPIGRERALAIRRGMREIMKHGLPIASPKQPPPSPPPSSLMVDTLRQLLDGGVRAQFFPDGSITLSKQ